MGAGRWLECKEPRMGNMDTQNTISWYYIDIERPMVRPLPRLGAQKWLNNVLLAPQQHNGTLVFFTLGLLLLLSLHVTVDSVAHGSRRDTRDQFPSSPIPRAVILPCSPPQRRWLFFPGKGFRGEATPWLVNPLPNIVYGASLLAHSSLCSPI
jgi:hypothetical protein